MSDVRDNLRMALIAIIRVYGIVGLWESVADIRATDPALGEALQLVIERLVPGAIARGAA